MDRLILVPLKQAGDIEQVLHYLDCLTRPCTKLVFLVPGEREGIRRFSDHVRIFYTGSLPQPILSNVLRTKQADRLLAAEQRLLPACESLKSRGVEIGVKLYSASYRKNINEDGQSEHASVLIVRSRYGNWTGRLLLKLLSIFHIFRSPDFHSVLLVHPSRRMKA